MAPVAEQRTGASVDRRAVLTAFSTGRYDPTCRIGMHQGWFAINTPNGPATLTMCWDNDGALDAEAFGPGRQWALDHASAMAGDHDTTATSFVPPPGPVADWHRRSPGLRIGRTSRVFDALVPVVLAQRVTSGEAVRSWSGLVRAFGAPAPRSNAPFALKCPPTAEALAKAPYYAFHRFGVDRGRAETIRFAAKRVDRLEEAATFEREQAYARLHAFPGIGVWTSALTLGMAIGDADAVAVGDFHLKNIVGWNLAGEARATDERMVELLEPYRGHRARVVALLGRHGDGAPKFGPRQRVLPIAQM
ncbi:MAG: DNA-3-methyladenine glycosylase [Acidimicrobiia bacterium]